MGHAPKTSIYTTAAGIPSGGCWSRLVSSAARATSRHRSRPILPAANRAKAPKKEINKMAATNAEGANAGKSEGPPPTSSSGDDRGQWSKARARPHPTLKSQKAPPPPLSPAVLPKAAIVTVCLREGVEGPAPLVEASPGSSWGWWRALLLAAMGEPLREDELASFRKLTEREQPPGKRVSELVGVIGRRGGKSRSIATLIC